MDQIIRAKYVLTSDKGRFRVLRNASVKVENNIITEIGQNLEANGSDVVNFDTHILMPGLVNSHTHSAMTLFRGHADDTPLDTWLNEHIWPLEAKLEAKDVEIGAKMAAVEALLSGTTTINSMYLHPDAEARAFTDVGIRSMIGPPIISGVNMLETNEHLISDWHGKHDDLIRVSINPHAPYTVTGEEFKKIHDYKNSYNAKNPERPLQVHTHLAEAGNEMDLIRSFLSNQGEKLDENIKTSTQYLDSLGILDENLITAHAVECSDNDLDILAQKGVGVSLNPVSNLKLGNNIGRVSQMIERGVKLSLGTDGPASNNSLDMFETMKISSLLQKSVNNNPTKGLAEDTLNMATKGGAKVLKWHGIGSIEEGKKADLILLDFNKPHLTPVTSDISLISSLVYSAKSSDVSDVMVNGRWRVRKREVLDIDLPSLHTEFNEAVQDLLSKS